MSTFQARTQLVFSKLGEAKQTKDEKQLSAVFAMIVDPAVNPRDVPAELFVECTEVALVIKQYDIALDCVTRYYETNPPKNQFYCRALFCRAQLEASIAHRSNLKGQLFVDQIRRGLDIVVQALDIATKIGKSETYGFLVHNASIVFYNLSRPLMREGYMRTLTTISQRFLDALEVLPVEQIDYPWFIRYGVNTARCYDDAGQTDSAIRNITKAMGAIKTYSTKTNVPPDLTELVFRAFIHMCRAKEGSVSSVAGDLEKNPELLPGSKGMYIFQKIKSGMIKKEDIEKNVIAAIDLLSPVSLSDSETKDTKDAKKAKKAKPEKKKGKGGEEEGKKEASKNSRGPSPQDLFRLGIIALLGRECVKHRLYRLAAICVEKTKDSKTHGLYRAWVLSQYTEAELLVFEGEAKQVRNAAFDGDLGVERLEFRLKAINILCQTLPSAMRLADAEVVQDGCILAWNICLPLFQPQYRIQTSRLLRICATALENIDSLLYRLRVQFYLELAKVDIDEDFLANASISVVAALQLDPTIPLFALPEEIKTTYEKDPDSICLFQRPLDRQLYPIYDRLDVNQNLYLDVSDPKLQALLAVEQSKAALSNMIRKNLLNKASALVADQEAQVSENPVDNRIRAAIWFDITTIAWDGQLYDVCLSGISKVLQYKWNATSDTMFLLQQAKALILKGQICAMDLEKLGFRPGRIELKPAEIASDEDDDDDDEDDAPVLKRAPPAAAQGKTSTYENISLNKAKKLQTDLLESFLQAIAIGQIIEEDWIVLNAATFIWNIHQQIFQEQFGVVRQLRAGSTNPRAQLSIVSADLREALTTCHAALLQLPTVDVGLICNIGTVIALSLEQLQQYENALKIGLATCEVESTSEKRVSLAILSRLYKKTKQAVQLPEERQASVFMSLELMQNPLVPVDEKTGILTDLLSVMENKVHDI
jgi:hypothetical protein